MVIRPARRSRRGLVFAAIFVFLLLGGRIVRFSTDVLWFREVGLSSVLFKSLLTQLGVGVAVAVLVALVVWVNLVLAGRIAPSYRARFEVVAGRPDPLDQYRDLLDPHLKSIRIAVALFVGLLTGLSAASAWQTVLLWMNRVSWEGVDARFQPDAQFGKDVGFYVFDLPFLRDVLGWLWFSLLAALLLSAFAHYFHGSIRPERGRSAIIPGALAHLSVLLGLLALVKAGQYWIGQYALNFSPSGTVTGASYTDIHARLPALKLLVLISIISAVLFLVNIRARRTSLPLAAVAIWVLTAILAGGVWPWWVQRFSVAPQEPQREAVYIARHLAATRTAFGLRRVQKRPFTAGSDLTTGDLRANRASLDNVRLWDPDVLELAYDQLQSIRTYYDFGDVDVDRYQVGGALRQVLISARELLLQDLPTNSQTWSNLHLQYTHGYGLAASLANASTSAGQPEFLVKDLPGTMAPGAGDLNADREQPRIYYGEQFQPSDYSVVGSKQSEVDYPTSGAVQLSRNNYSGAGGIPVSGFLRRLLFAIRERDPNLVLSSLISGNSRIMIYKNVRDRVLRAAPFLSLDNDPYPAVVDGRLVWILDAYTSTPWYPYSERFDATEILGGGQAGSLTGSLNYMRNSVKVVVDATNGTLDFYLIDSKDPLIRAWSKAFPDLFTDAEPSSDLRAHFRYPEDLFNVQSDVYLTYHMTDPQDFYSKEDAWQVPVDLQSLGNPGSLAQAAAGAGSVPPTYLVFKLPGDSTEQFMLTRPFTPRGKNNMIALMAGRSDPEEYGELVSLQLPRQSLIAGPSQVDNLINQDVRISKLLSLLKQQGSDTDFGSLVTLPIEDSIMYVQPIFVRATSGGIPELKKVVLVYGERVEIADGFEGALEQVFGDVARTEPPPAGGGGGGKGGGGGPSGPQDEQLTRTIERAGALYQRAQRALQKGDLATYAELIDRVGKLLERAKSLSGQ
ncbi:UPF0182 family protein [soil metagenome]